IHPSGRSMEVKTSDDRVITVNFNRPLIDSVKGLVEIHGVGSGKNVMTGEFFVEFPEEMSETFGKFFYCTDFIIIKDKINYILLRKCISYQM
ncbi:Uncharacterized protein GBIM_22104, partial [Gryllus bimaculatus]